MERINNRPQKYQVMLGTAVASIAAFLLFVFIVLGLFGLIDILAGG